MNEEINSEESIFTFGLCLRGLSEKKIPGVEEEDLPPSLFDLGDQRGFLGDPTKRVSKSPTRLDLAHHIIRVEDAELGLWG